MSARNVSLHERNVFFTAERYGYSLAPEEGAGGPPAPCAEGEPVMEDR